MRIFLAAIVAALGLASVQPNNEAVTSYGNALRKIQQNFLNFFDSIGKNDHRQSETYRTLLEKETRKEQQDFDSMKDEFRSARQRNVKQRRLHEKNGHMYEDGAALKRDARKNDDQADTTDVYHVKIDDELLAKADAVNNYTAITLNFTAKYLGKGYVKWEKLHNTTKKDLETLCSKYALMLSNDERIKFTVEALKSYRDEYLLMGRGKKDTVEVDTLTCLVMFMDKKGKEESRMKYYLTEGPEPDSAFRFALLQTTVVLTRYLTNIWSKETKSADWTVQLKLRVYNTTTAKAKLTKSTKSGKKTTKSAVANATEGAEAAETTTAKAGKGGAKEGKKKKGGKKE